MNLNFFKYQGTGNDFILLDGRQGFSRLDKRQVSFLCDRRFGIGADGLMILENDAQTDFRMRYFNSDGGESTMCGNGGRCITLFAEHLGIGGSIKTFSAADGIHRSQLLSIDGNSADVRLQMIDVESVEPAGDGYFINTGSPHYVEFVRDVASVDVFREGCRIRNSGVFKRFGGVNVNFVQRMTDGAIRIRTYERGVENETLACGTGSVAAVLATATAFKPQPDKFSVETSGGMLFVLYSATPEKKFENIFLEGRAAKVFAGTIDICR